MSSFDEKFIRLKEPFPADSIEWRIGRAWNGRQGLQAVCLAYLTSRAVQDRLDEVMGPAHWRNEYQKGPDGGILCGLSLRIAGEWLTKWDGAQNTNIESVKGGLSGAMKRAAVQWGIGRYLYALKDTRAIIAQGGQYWQAANKKTGLPGFAWNPPEMPEWALPSALMTEKQRELILKMTSSSVFSDEEKRASVEFCVKGTKKGASAFIARIQNLIATRKKAQKQTESPVLCAYCKDKPVTEDNRTWVIDGAEQPVCDECFKVIAADGHPVRTEEESRIEAESTALNT